MSPQRHHPGLVGLLPALLIALSACRQATHERTELPPVDFVCPLDLHVDGVYAPDKGELHVYVTLMSRWGPEILVRNNVYGESGPRLSWSVEDASGRLLALEEDYGVRGQVTLTQLTSPHGTWSGPLTNIYQFC